MWRSTSSVDQGVTVTHRMCVCALFEEVSPRPLVTSNLADVDRLGLPQESFLCAEWTKHTAEGHRF